MILLALIPVLAQGEVSTQLLNKFEGVAVGDNLGYSVSFIGDLDSDGSSDILLGAPGASPGGVSGAGSVFLYSGRTYSLIHRFDGQSVGEDFGISVAGIDDLNLDGIPDILIGADGADPGGRSDAGSVYVYSGLSPFALIGQLEGEAAGDFFGTSAVSLGDLAGDRRPELAVGAIGVDPDSQRTNAGRVYVYNGDLTLLRRLDGTAAQDDFGISVAGPGDVDGDGFPDILVGADFANPGTPARVNAGSAYLLSGQTFGLLQRFDGEVAGDFFGSSVSGAGDVDGDGYPDLLFGAPGADPANVTESGSAYLFSSASYALIHRFDGSSAGDDFGWRVALGGDVDCDGSPDPVIAADLADPTGIADAGSVYIFSGGNYSLLTQVNGEAEGDNLGSSVAAGADSSGDEMPDFLAGAPYNSPNAILEAGGAYLYKTGSMCPVARFSFGPSKPIIGQTVSFNGSASTSPNGPILSFSWTFGDGGAATGATVSHAYAAAGRYTVTLKAVDSTNAVGMKTETVRVNLVANQLPAAQFTFMPSSPVAGQSIEFDASSSSDSDGSIVSYSWDMGDGSTRNGVAVTHTYSAEAAYNVTLTVRDDAGAANSTTQQLQVLPASELIATASASTTGGIAPLTVTFTGQASGGASPYTFSWDFGDGQAATGGSSTHQYSSPGSYQAELNVTDSLGNTAIDTITITVVAVLPGLAVTASYEPTGGIAPLTAQFNATASGGQGSYTFIWNFGDGQTSGGAPTSHTYSVAGNYTVRVTVQDGDGNTASDTIVVTVLEQRPPMVGPIPAEYLLYGLVAAIAGVVVLAALYLQRPRPVKPVT